MMQLVVDPSAIVVNRVIFDDGMGRMPMELIDHLDSIESNDGAPAGSTGDLRHLVSLNGNLNRVVFGNEGHLPMKSWLGDAIEEGTTAVVHANVSLRYSVEANPMHC